jgi:hypothetical protein
MANRQSRPVQAEEFKGRGTVAEGLLPVARPDGQFARQEAASFAGLADQLNAIADRQAIVEGDRAGKTAGMDPNYRPSGSTTLRGMALEKAATSTYVDQLNVKMRESVWKAYQENINNPAGLEASLTKIKGEFSKDVFPEIAGQFEQEWQRSAMPYRHQAFRDVVDQTRSQARASLITNVDSIDAETERLARMPDSPAKAQRLDELAGQRRAALGRAVQDRAIDPDKAATLNLKSDQDTIRKTVTARIMELPAEKRPEALKALDEERRSGKGPLGKLRDDTFDAIKSGVESDTRIEDTQKNRTFNEWNRQAGSIARRLEQGFPPNDLELGKLRLGAGMLKDARADQVLTNIEDLSAAQTLVRGKTLPEQRKVLAELERKINADGATEHDKRRFKLVTGMVGEMEKGLARDPVGTAEAEGVIKPTPLDISSPDAFAKTLGARIDAAKAAGQRYESPWKAFKPEEVTTLKIALSEGGDRAIAITEAIVKAGGKDTRRLLQELGDTSPELAHIGALVATGNAGQREAARDAMRAKQLAREKGTNLPGMAVNDVESKALGNSVIDLQQDRVGIRETGKLIFQSRLPPGTDPKSTAAETLAVEAMKDAAGRHKVGGVDYGGPGNYSHGWFSSSYKVLVPSNVRTDRFRDVVLAIDDKMLDGLPGGRPVDPKGKPYTARQFHNAVPVRVPGGYRFALGDPAERNTPYIAGPGGRPFVLDLDALEPVLRTKVPAAYLGGRQ